MISRYVIVTPLSSLQENLSLISMKKQQSQLWVTLKLSEIKLTARTSNESISSGTGHFVNQRRCCASEIWSNTPKIFIFSLISRITFSRLVWGLESLNGSDTSSNSFYACRLLFYDSVNYEIRCALVSIDFDKRLYLEFIDQPDSHNNIQGTMYWQHNFTE